MRIPQAISKISKRNRHSLGFSLVEVMVSMAIGGVGIVALYGSLGMGTNMLQSSRENLRATQILVEKMETLRLYTFDQVCSNGFIPLTFSIPFDPQWQTSSTNSSSSVTFSGRVIVTNAPVAASYQSDLKLITVDLTWTSGALVRHRDLSTLVSRHGLQTYIY